MRTPGAAFRAVELRHQRQQRFGAQRDVDGDPQFHLPAARDLLDAAFHLAGHLEQAAPFVQEFASGGREFGAAAAAVEELHAEVLLELGHGVSEC